MDYLLMTAAALCFKLRILHSVLGERIILAPLFERGQLPKLSGSEQLTQQTLRFPWHVTTVLLWGVAGVLGLLAMGHPGGLFHVLCWTFAVCAAVALIATRAKHFSWIVFATFPRCSRQWGVGRARLPGSGTSNGATCRPTRVSSPPPQAPGAR